MIDATLAVDIDISTFAVHYSIYETLEQGISFEVAVSLWLWDTVSQTQHLPLMFLIDDIWTENQTFLIREMLEYIM